MSAFVGFALLIAFCLGIALLVPLAIVPFVLVPLFVQRHRLRTAEAAAQQALVEAVPQPAEQAPRELGVLPRRSHYVNAA